MASEWNVLALHKGAEQYLFVYDDQSASSLIDSFRRFASNEELTFNWFDAAVMTEKCKGHLPVSKSVSEVSEPSATSDSLDIFG